AARDGTRPATGGAQEAAGAASQPLHPPRGATGLHAQEVRRCLARGTQRARARLGRQVVTDGESEKTRGAEGFPPRRALLKVAAKGFLSLVQTHEDLKLRRRDR